MTRHLASAFGLLLAMAMFPAHAEMTVTDLQIAARALSFMEHPLTGTVRLGIIYVPGDETSIREADQVVSLLGDGLHVGNLTMTPVRVPVDKAGTAPVDLFFLPVGIGNEAQKVSAAAKKRKLTCFTLDIKQVENGACVLGIESQPKVRIYVNQAAADASNSSFVTVFLMMVTEV
jgi:ABC-type uncharacterized transport system substrate-binding protein